MHLEATPECGLDLLGGVRLQVSQRRGADLLGGSRGGIEADRLHHHVLVVVQLDAGRHPAHDRLAGWGGGRLQARIIVEEAGILLRLGDFRRAATEQQCGKQ
ncbi:hypothetical protein D3C78_1404230 [compost metagenome]